MRSKNIRFDVIKGEIANNKVKEITNWLMKGKEKFSSSIFFAGQEEDQKEAKDF